MSEEKRVSPLLDGFTLGAPMSEHDGVRCCPAIKENTEKKYIVKTITIPATQIQMDALLLAGAFKDPSGAMDYYKEVAEDVVKEAELLEKLSRLEGFLPYDGWQIEPITRRRLGYEVYLLSSYKRSLEKQLRTNPVTHLEAINLGLDVCSALTLCRQSGALYVDLKPSNIFISEQKEHRIGDLGFVSLDSLSYTTLPSKYISAYTPPELEDPMAALNTTADTYALGMILYQLYNDSQLPSREDVLAGTIPSPANADYELAEIIMKAIHSDPQQRWQDPSAMGQALVAYMQRNAVNDDPITPHTPLLPAEEPVVAEQAVPEEPESAEEVPETASSEVNEVSDVAEPTSEEPVSEDSPAEESVPEEQDETVPGEEDADLLQPHEMSEELSKIVAQADDLIAHELPEGVVVPEPPELPDPFAFAKDETEDMDDSDIPLDPVMEDEPTEPEKSVKKKKTRTRKFISPAHKRKIRGFLTTLLLLAALAAVGLCGYLYYQLFYLQPVSAITIYGEDQQFTVQIITEADPATIKVVCSDSYGNVRSEFAKNGIANFTGLLPDTTYTIQLEADGFHKLSGETSAVYTTDANSSIVSFQSVAGPEDGSLILNFTVDGEEPDEWTMICSAEGEKDRKQTFTGHSVTFDGLTVGTVYTFTLIPNDGLTLSGMTNIDVMAPRLILAKDLAVNSSDGQDLIVSWKSPGDVVIDSWEVHCYNNKGFDVRFSVTEELAVIPGATPGDGYTVEVTAAGMTQPSRLTISTDPILINAFTLADSEDPKLEKLELNWEFTGDAPKGGWLLMYTVDASGTPIVVKCKEPSAVISPRIPGAKYRFTLQAADGTTVFNNIHAFEFPETTAFEAHGLKADTVTANMLKTPADKNWRYETINDSSFTDTFEVGDAISVVLRAQSPFYHPGNDTRILYVFRDTHGNVIQDLTAQEKVYWKNIWTGGDAKTGELDVPTSPSAPGSYVLEIYIDGMTMAQLPLTMQ